MPCPTDQNIAFDKIEGTDLGELLPAGCSNTVEACKEACESMHGCCGYNFVWNVGQWYSQKVGRCEAKACDGRIGTSRYGMVYYLRDAGAVVLPPFPPGLPSPPSSPPHVSCWAAGWRDSGDSSGSHECPLGQKARDEEEVLLSSSSTNPASECCYPQCWASGWRNFGDTSGTAQCPTGHRAQRSSFRTPLPPPPSPPLLGGGGEGDGGGGGCPAGVLGGSMRREY